MSFVEFPQLLATANRLNHGKTEIGHINHTSQFMGMYCDYVGEELKVETIEWVKNQIHLNVTLDIGTCAGITLLAVLLISRTKEVSQVKLVEIIP